MCQHQLTGLNVFDARLAATMIVHRIGRILIFDSGYGVIVLDPATV